MLQAAPKEEDPEVTADFSVECKTELQNTLYPSMIFGLTEIEKQTKDTVDYFTIKVKPNIKSDIKIVIEESKLNFETIITETAVNGEKTIYPVLKWKYDDLKNLSQPGNVDITFVCYSNDKELGRKTLRLSYASINECVLAAKFDNENIPLYPLISAYINEDSPIIDKFLQEVLNNSELEAFSGYQVDEEGVIEQVEACFYTLRAKGVKYSSITTTSIQNKNIISQYVRFSDEVLNNTQANCADGSVFLCSVLRKIGIHSVLVFIPGHVYVGYFVDDRKYDLMILETTLIGDLSADFYDASAANVDALNDKIDYFQNDDYFDGYFIIDVDEAREIIKPIGRK